MRDELTATLGGDDAPGAAARRHARGDPAVRPPGLGQDHHRAASSPSGWPAAGAIRCWSPPTCSAPRRSSSSSRSARGSSIPVLTPEPGEIGRRARPALAQGGRERGRDVVLFDTAGRLHVDQALMAELEAARRRGRPGRDPLRRRRDDRPGRGQERRRSSPSVLPLTGRAAHQARRRRPRRRRALGRARWRTSRSASPASGEKPEDLELFLADAHGLAHPRHGRRAGPDREGPGDGRRQGGRSASPSG